MLRWCDNTFLALLYIIFLIKRSDTIHLMTKKWQLHIILSMQQVQLRLKIFFTKNLNYMTFLLENYKKINSHKKEINNRNCHLLCSCLTYFCFILPKWKLKNNWERRFEKEKGQSEIYPLQSGGIKNDINQTRESTWTPIRDH